MHVLITGSLLQPKQEIDTNVFYIPTLEYITVSVVMDAKKIVLVAIEKEDTYYVYYDKEKLYITKNTYNNLIQILSKLNIEEATLLNELKLEKACKNGTKELEDIDFWSKKEVNNLMGIVVE